MEYGPPASATGRDRLRGWHGLVPIGTYRPHRANPGIHAVNRTARLPRAKLRGVPRRPSRQSSRAQRRTRWTVATRQLAGLDTVNPGWGLVPARSRPAGDRGPEVRSTRARSRPAVLPRGRARHPDDRPRQRTIAPKPLIGSRETADGFLPRRIRLALRDGLNVHKAVNFWPLIAGRLPRYRSPAVCASGRGHFAHPRPRAVRPHPTAARRHSAGIIAKTCREISWRGERNSGGNGGSMVCPSRGFLRHRSRPGQTTGGQMCRGRNCGMRRGALHTIAARPE